MMTPEGLLIRANARAQRRLRAMVTAKAYPNPQARETILYTQAERLVDSLLTEATWEARKAELDHLQTQDHDAHINFGVFVTECDDCCCDPEGPGIPADEFAAIYLSGPGVLAEMYGR